MNKVSFSYEKSAPARSDAISSQVASLMVGAILNVKTEREDEMAMDQSLSEKDIEKEKSQLHARIEQVVEDCMKYVDAPNNIRNIVNDLYSKLEYGLVIKVGTRCHERIAFLKEQNDQRQELQQQIFELQQQQVVSPSEEQKEEIETLQRKLTEEFPVEYMNNTQLDHLTLAVATTMIEAAKVEERNDVLRDQAILRFTVSPTIALFEEVKILTDEDEWEDVKSQLLEKILKSSSSSTPDSFGGGSLGETINPKDKIELLLNEGLWKECISIFPEPPYGGLELLERLFLDVERNNPKLLDQLLPVIEKYAVYSYQSYVFENASLDRLLDQVQKRAPDFIFGLFSRGTEQMLLNILPKQYADFVHYLEIFKRRLNDELGRTDDWDTFISELIKKHKGKRKLMQLIQHSNLKD